MGSRRQPGTNSLLGRWCAACSKASDQPLKEVRATIKTTFGPTSKVLALCPACRQRASDCEVAALFARQFNVDPMAVTLPPGYSPLVAIPEGDGPGQQPSPGVWEEPEPALAHDLPLDVVRMAEGIGAVTPGGLLRCPNCQALAAISPDARQWGCIGNVDMADDAPCGAGGDAVDYAGHILERQLGISRQAIDFRERVLEELDRRGLAGRSQ